jgi:hypothetical protein
MRVPDQTLSEATEVLLEARRGIFAASNCDFEAAPMPANRPAIIR